MTTSIEKLALADFNVSALLTNPNALRGQIKKLHSSFKLVFITKNFNFRLKFNFKIAEMNLFSDHFKNFHEFNIAALKDLSYLDARKNFIQFISQSVSFSLISASTANFNYNCS